MNILSWEKKAPYCPVTNRLLKAHRITYDSHDLYLWSCLILDINQQSPGFIPSAFNFYELKDRLLSSRFSEQSSYVKFVTDHFYNTFQLPDPDFSAISESFPLTKSYLEFIFGIKSEFSPCCPHSINNYFFGPEFGISFGSYNYFSLFSQIYYLCGLKSTTLTILYRDAQTSVLSGFFNLFNSHPNVVLHDYSTSKLSLDILSDFIYSNGLTGFLNYSQKLLTRTFNIYSESSVICGVSDNLSFTSRFLNFELLSNYTTQKIVHQIDTLNISSTFFARVLSLTSNKKVIGFVNRDAMNVGDSQPWRDTPIEFYIPHIKHLISLGFYVIRLNYIGQPTSFKHPYFLDLVTTNCSQLDQLQIINLCDCVIGSSTGIADVSRISFGKPNLILNSSIIYAYLLQGCTVFDILPLSIANQPLLSSTPVDVVLSVLFKDHYTPQNLSSVGLKVSDVHVESQLQLIDVFITSLSRFEFSNFKRLSSLLKSFHLPSQGYDQLLSPSAYNQLFYILTSYFS